MDKKTKVLLVSPIIINPKNGMARSIYSHKKMLSNIFGEDNVFSCVVANGQDERNMFYLGHTKNKISSLINTFFGYIRGFNRKCEKSLFKIIKEIKPQIIFFDFSCFGKTIKKIKKDYQKINILSYFHDVNYDFERYKAKHVSPLYWFVANSSKKLEKKTCKYSDVIIALNNEDSKRINTLYKRKADLLLPICMEDKLNKSIQPNKDEYLLFVGSYFFANIASLIKFDREVAPFIKYKVIIVGHDMEKTKNQIKSSNISVVGEVEDLSDYYINATAVISPILFGAGMKVKNAEAMMYGKEIIGTTSSFIGYETNSSCHIANNPKEFIDIINNTKFEKFNSNARLLYEENYSLSHNEEILRDYFDCKTK